MVISSHLTKVIRNIKYDRVETRIFIILKAKSLRLTQASCSSWCTNVKELTIIVTSLVSSSIMMLPYCRSLWQNPILWFSPDNSFTKVAISSSMSSKRNFLASWVVHKFLAALSQFLQQSEIMNCLFLATVQSWTAKVVNNRYIP